MSDHHDHHLPPPEPDHVDAGGVTFWGLASFISVLAVVGGLSGYFWIEREAAVADTIEQYGSSPYRAEMDKQRAELNKTITEAMRQVTDGAGPHARAQAFAMPVTAAAPAPAPAPVAQEVALVVDAALAKKGEALYNNPQKMCSVCHSLDGSKKVGPSFKGLWGRKEKLADGSEVTVNQAYFIRSVREPNAQVVAGYPPAMPMPVLTDDEVTALMHFVASQK
jgi:mono/diheme cytochrome c family protein